MSNSPHRRPDRSILSVLGSAGRSPDVCRRIAESGEPLFQPLEPRLQLAADLGVSFDADRFELPEIAVPGDFIQPDTGFETGILVINNGPDEAVGLVNIAFYLSLDTVLNTSTDLLMRRFDSEPLSLLPFSGDPNDIGNFSPDMRIPADAPPGDYHVIIRITYPNSQIGDFNSSNDIAVSTDTVSVERKFGNVGGRSGVTMVLEDAEDTLIAFSLSGAGTGTVTIDGQGRYLITTTGTGSTSDISLTTDGGDASFDLAQVTINGAIRSFAAPAARLVGAFTPGTSMSSLTLGDVISAGTLTIPSTSVAPSFTLGDVRDFSITSGVGITSIAVKSWTNIDSTTDSISAPFLDALSTQGTGNFGASIALSGGAAPGRAETLRSVSIGGVIRGATWVVHGLGGSISALASTADFAASFTRRLASLSTTGTFRGTITAAHFGTINIGKDILAARILAGTFLGNDGAFGGTGDNADTFAPGRFDRILVTRNVANSTIAAGLKSISGSALGEPREILGGVNSKFGELRIGNAAGRTARFLANRYNGPTTIRGVNVDWRTNDRFELVTLAPAVVATNIVVNPSNATISIRIDSFGLMDIASVSTGFIRITGPNGFSQIATLVSKRFQPGSLQRTVTATFRVDAPGGAWSMSDNGEYAAHVVNSIAQDTRANFVAPGNFTDFLVSF